MDVSLVEANLRDEFSKHCEIDRVTVIRDKVTRVSKGFAYIVCKTDADASTAMREMDGKVLMDRPIKVKYSHSETPEWLSVLENRGSLREETTPSEPRMSRGGRGGPMMFSRGGRGGPLMRGGPMRGGPMRGGPMRGGPMRGGPMRGSPGGRGRGGPRGGGYGSPNGDSPRGRGAPLGRDDFHGRDAPLRGRDGYRGRGDGGREMRGRGGPPRGQSGPPRGQSGPPRGQGGSMRGQGGPQPRDRGYLGYDEGDGYDMGGAADRGESEQIRRRPPMDERPSRPQLRPETSSIGGRYQEDKYSRAAPQHDPYSERTPVRRTAADPYPPQRSYDDAYDRRPAQDPYNDGYAARDPVERPPARGSMLDRREPERTRQPVDYPPARDAYRERSPIRRDPYADDPYAQKSSQIDASYRGGAADARPAPRGRADPYGAPPARSEYERRPAVVDRYSNGADSSYPPRASERAAPQQRQYAAADPYSQTSARSLMEPVGRNGGRPMSGSGYGGY